MNINVHITGNGDSNRAHVEADGSLRVSMGDPPLVTPRESPKVQYFAGFLSSSGIVDFASDGNMNSDGSVSREKYYIEAAQDYDIHITHAIIVIADTAVVHNNFGNVSALANGWDLQVVQGGVTTPIINKAKTSGRVMSQTGLNSPFGTNTDVNELSNWTGTEDAHVIVFPFGQIVPGGLVLARGSTDRLISVVNDDLTGLTEFTVRVLGYKRIP
jgi:hypothetical protein